MKKRKFYISVKTKFFISLIVSLLWVGISIFLSLPWIRDLSNTTNIVVALIIILGLAYIPGFLNSFLITSILLDKQPKFKNINPDDEITILIAAYNEEKSIYNTLKQIKNLNYKGKINTIVIDNNSSDNTVKEVNRAKESIGLENLICISELKPGKFNALNKGLSMTSTKYVITLDADTLLHKESVRHLVARINSAPKETSAVAGSVLARNSRDNLLTKLQEWDYFLAIMSIKRMQGLFQGTLVAQGAFSIYKTDVLKQLGGWTDAIGEDIVLTWKMLSIDKKVYFEPKAISFTDVPTKFSHFYKQRSRWARGMIEGFRTVKPWQQPNMFIKFLTAIDIFIPIMDFSYTLFFIPGCILALFGNFLIVGPYLLLVIPLTFITFLIFYLKQKPFFTHFNLKVRKNRVGFFCFVLFYQLLMSPISLIGYVQELFGVKRVWK